MNFPEKFQVFNEYFYIIQKPLTESLLYKVLLVEDSVSMRDWLQKNIGTMPNIEICGCSSFVEDAIGLIGRLNPNLVILDIRLKDGTGTKVLSYIKNNFPSIRVIIFSNYMTFKAECDELGVDYFFDKAFESSKLIPIVTGLAESAEQSRGI